MKLNDDERILIGTITPLQAIQLAACLRTEQLGLLTDDGFSAKEFLRSFTIEQIRALLAVFTDAQRTAILILAFQSYFNGELD